MLTDVSRLAAFVKWCLSCAILEGLRGTNGVADSVSSASCGRPATGPAAAAAQNFGALAVHSLNDQGDFFCNATGKLARFPAPFSSYLPGLFVACDDTHKTYPFAPGMATSTGRGETRTRYRIGVQGSRVRHHRHRSSPPTYQPCGAGPDRGFRADGGRGTPSSHRALTRGRDRSRQNRASPANRRAPPPPPGPTG